MLHLPGGVAQAAEDGAYPGLLGTAAGDVQKLDGAPACVKALPEVLGHIGGADVAPGQELGGYAAQEGGLARAVRADDADALRAGDAQLYVPGQGPAARLEQWQVELEHALPGGY